MGWGEFQKIPNEYNDRFRFIDQSLIELLKERKSLAKGKRYFPSKEIMQEWASSYEMDIPQISWLIHSLNEGSHPVMSNELGELFNVLPIMKKSVVDGVEYQITHAMQHRNGSIVCIEIMLIESNEQHVHLRPQLLLEVKGSNPMYNARRNGFQGGGGQTQLRFLVSPPLPDNLNEVSFMLSPYAIPMDNPPKEIILNKEVYFG